MIKLSVNETKWSSLLARTRALILYISIWIFDFGPVKLPGLSRNRPQDLCTCWPITVEHSFFRYREYPEWSGFQAGAKDLFISFGTNSCTVIAVFIFSFSLIYLCYVLVFVSFNLLVLLFILSLLLSLSLLLLLLIIFWMPVFCVVIYSVSEIPTQSTKKGRFKDRHSCSHEQWRLEPLAPPWKILSYVPLKTFWDHKWSQTLHKVEIVQFISASKIIAGSGHSELETGLFRVRKSRPC